MKCNMGKIKNSRTQQWHGTCIAILLGMSLVGCSLRDSTLTATPGIGPGPTSQPIELTATTSAIQTQAVSATQTVVSNQSPVEKQQATQTAEGVLQATQTAVVSPQTTQTATVDENIPATVTNPELTSPIPAASIPLETIFGVEVDRIDPAVNLPLAKSAGARWIRRVAVPWKLVEPEEGRRDWNAIAGLESEFKVAVEQGFKLIIVARESPPFAQSIARSSCSPIKKEKLGAFTVFMHDLVVRYSQPPFNVRYWEIWNEPDIDPRLVDPDSLFGCWGDENDSFYGGGYYADMLRLIYPAMKQASPEAQVMVGGLLLDCDPRNPPAGKDCKPSLFLEGILRNGGGDYFDGVAFHAYDYYENPVRGDYHHPGWRASAATTGPVVGVKAQFLRETLFRYGHAKKFLMNTEMSLVCGRTGSEPQCLKAEFTDTKAAYVVQSYITSLIQGLRAAIWYTLSGWRGSGLLDEKLQPNMAYATYRFAAQQLQGITEIYELKTASGLRGYELRKRDARLWVIWSVDGAQHDLSLDSSPQAYFDYSGKQYTGGMTVLIGPMPIYLIW